MKFSRATIALYIGLVFASGAVVGVLGQRLYTASTVIAKATPPSSDEWRKKYMAENTERLKLTPEQISKWENLLDETRARTRAAWKTMDPEIESIRNEGIEKIRQMLTPEQRAGYDALRKERDERQKKKGPGHPNGPGL
jgi:Spy/CpxP family protein refolding chaperone